MMDHPHVSLTERQASFLAEIQAMGFDHGEWFRPMDIGGRNGSEHSAVLSELVPKGLIESRQRHSSAWGSARGSKIYRLTEAGREWCD